MRRLSFLLLAATALATAARADEGMWLPSQAPEIADKLKAAGLKLDPRDLADLHKAPLNAIATLGGCTTAFVSAQGLAVTNHHCVQGSIQYNSSPERDYLTNGFLAAQLADELPAAPGTRINVIEDLRDVTDRAIAGATTLNGKARADKIEANIKALIAECEVGSPGTELEFAL